MPLLQVTLTQGRTPEQIENVIAALTDTLVSTLGVKQESVRVVIQEVAKTHFGSAGMSLARRDGKPAGHTENNGEQQ